jgi:sortase A
MILKWTGRTLIAAGVLILLFVVYQLFGTNVLAKQSQKALEVQLEQSFEWRSPAPSPSPGATPEPSPSPAAPRKADPGTGLAIIDIPKIGLHAVVVHGVGVRDLRLGPGHLPGSAMPGAQGNVVISGHRTTYGAPFSRINELSEGDTITLTTATGKFEYRTTDQEIVAPTEVSVVAPTKDGRLTLTTCHPKFSAKQRLIVTAALVSPAQEVPAA